MLLQFDLKHIHKVNFYQSDNNFTQALVLLVTNMISGYMHWKHQQMPAMLELWTGERGEQMFDSLMIILLFLISPAHLFSVGGRCLWVVARAPDMDHEWEHYPLVTHYPLVVAHYLLLSTTHYWVADIDLEWEHGCGFLSTTAQNYNYIQTVSYTHLTLPTKA